MTLFHLRRELADLESQIPNSEEHACDIAMRVSALRLMIMLRLTRQLTTGR